MAEPLIHILPPQIANQIAAGEVVERPASVVKELIENSLDAGATMIRIHVEAAGRKRIEVDDDGCGMHAADARLALQRHATSKIVSADDLHAIASHGFRGEALPSIASVSRLVLHTAAGDEEGVRVSVAGGADARVQPASPRRGTCVSVCDLFFNTPARRRFLRTDRTEEAVILETVRALALANPATGFRLMLDDRQRLHVPSRQTRTERVVAVMGRAFGADSRPFRLEHEGVIVEGSFGLPTAHYRDGSHMLVFVNGRVVRDRMLLVALRAGYRDVMFHDRFPQCVVWLEMDPADVDVNVHPAKREVRFKSPQTVRAALVACARAAIDQMGQTVSATPGRQALDAMRPAGFPARPTAPATAPGGAPQVLHSLFSAPQAHEPERTYAADTAPDLGTPLAQVHRCYILTQTDSGIVLVDQHAAAERIGYEKMKRQLADGGLARQMLLPPVDWQPMPRMVAWLHAHAGELARFGFEVEPRGEEVFVIRAMPAILGDTPPVELVTELTEAVMAIGVEQEGAGRILERWLGNRACRGAIKSGRVLKPEEQEALLREMERTPNIAQCNHGRPTYVRLSLSDLECLFGRKA